MRRKPRGARRRLASPAQMDRLRAVTQLPLPQPFPFEIWRHMMREFMNPDANFETRLAAWEHFTTRDRETWATPETLAQTLGAVARATTTPPDAEM